MASGKSLEKQKDHKVRVWQTKDGSPIRRKTPKQRITKKLRRKVHNLQKDISGDKMKKIIFDEVVNKKPATLVSVTAPKPAIPAWAKKLQKSRKLAHHDEKDVR